MSDRKLILTVVTPQRRVFQDSVNMVIARTTEGEIGVLPGHTPLVALMGIGPMTIKMAEGEQEAAINGGFIEVNPDQVTVITESAEMAGEIDITRAEKARQRALARLEKKQADIDNARAQAALQRATVRLRVAGHGD